MRQLAIDERAGFAAYLATLTPQQWEAKTLCANWTVRDVVAHVISYEDLPLRGLLGRFVRGRFIPAKINALGVAEYSSRSPEELLAFLANHLEPRGFTSAFGGTLALVDGMIHQQDIRRPLNHPREIPPLRLQAALRGALLAPPIRAHNRVRNLRLVATDLDWTSGHGPEVHGPAEALLMAIAGRRQALTELSGPGHPTLTARIDRAQGKTHTQGHQHPNPHYPQSQNP